MPRLKVSKLTDALTVHSGADHLEIAPGATVDLDARIGDTTVGEALGAHISAFIDPEPAADTARPSTQRKRAEAPAPESI